MTWREQAAPIIAGVIAGSEARDVRTLRRLLRDAWPWGERRNWPYRVWCDEVRRQLGIARRRRRRGEPKQGVMF